MTESLEEYSEYLSSQVRVAYCIVWDRACLLFFPIWSVVIERFSGFWATAPLFWLCIFWGLDFVLGSGRAYYAGEWRSKRALLSAVKLSVWCCVLLVAHALRDSRVIGGSIVSSLLETVVLFSEISSVLIHVGILSGVKLLIRTGEAFRSGSDRAANKAAEILEGQPEENQKG